MHYGDEYYVDVGLGFDPDARSRAELSRILEGADRLTAFASTADGGFNCAGCHGDPWDEPPYDEALPGIRRVAGARSCTIYGSIYGTDLYPDGAPRFRCVYFNGGSATNHGKSLSTRAKDNMRAFYANGGSVAGS